MIFLRLFILGLSLFNVCEAGETSVFTEKGTYLGKTALSAEGKTYHAFLGIRFARSDRFSKPVKEPKLAGSYNATYSRNGCIQVMIFENGRVEGAEDCLFLDIYTPEVHSSHNRKSVMVWIHGGGFNTGKAKQFDGSSLAINGDIIFVAIQYRLGPFGFLSTSDDVIPGNYGLWDQHVALQWVKENIFYFGGNPDSVTIFGESAGACSVNLHLVSLKSKGLFKRAVSQSGYCCTKENQRPVTYALAKMVDCFPSKSSIFSNKTLHTNILKCLKTKDARTVYNASLFLGDGMKSGAFDFFFSPTVDGDFLPRPLFHLLGDRTYLQETSFPDADIMVSVNNIEGGAFYFLLQKFDSIFKTSDAKSFKTLRKFQSVLITPHLKNRYGIQSEEILDTVTFEYVYPYKLNAVTISRDPAVKFITDMFVTATIDIAMSHSAVLGNGKTYLYLFNHDQKLVKYPFKGMIHGMDLVYTFGFAKFQMKVFVGSANATVPPSEKEISDILITFLTDFAKYGNPNRNISSKLGEDWPEFNNVSESYLALNSNMSVQRHMYPRVTSLWGDLVPHLVISARNRFNHQTCPANTGPAFVIHFAFIFIFTLFYCTIIIMLYGV